MDNNNAPQQPTSTPPTNQQPQAPNNVTPPQPASFVNKDASKEIPSATTMKEWPGAFGIYKISKAAIKLNFSKLATLVVIIVGTEILYAIIRAVLPGQAAKALFGILYEIFSTVIGATLIYATIESVKGNQFTVGDAFSKVFGKAVDIFLASMLVLIVIVLSVVLFIIPVFFIAPRVYLTVYYVIDKDMGVMDAFKASWNSTKGNVGKVYGIVGVNLLIILPAITIIGLIATVYFGILYYAASAVLYIFISKGTTDKTPTLAPAPTPGPQAIQS